VTLRGPREAGEELGSLNISLGRRGLGALGLASIAIILIGALAAAIPYRGYAGESYSPLNHFISELGEIAASRLAWSYNLGIVVGGLGLGIFLLLVSRAMSGRPRVAFVIFSLAAAISGPLCGVFPMDYHSTHRLVSAAFFLTGWLVAGTFTLWLLRARESAFPRWLIVPGLLVVTVFVSFIAVYSTYQPEDPNAHILVRSDVWTVPLLEWASLLSLLGWLALLAVSLIRQPRA
jgi:hypothetical membrane protein